MLRVRGVGLGLPSPAFSECLVRQGTGGGIWSCTSDSVGRPGSGGDAGGVVTDSIDIQ